jgi:DUF1009 family protein
MPWRKLGIIAGGGALPLALAEHCAVSGQAYFVARVEPFADADYAGHPNAAHNVGAMAARIAALKAEDCDAIVFAGYVTRPDFTQVIWDEGGRAMLPALTQAARDGDDALLRALVAAHAKAGFEVVGADQIAAGLLAPAGQWGAATPNARDLNDLKKAAEVAAALGALDVGQGAVSCDGLVLAVEAQEGTDQMLKRVASLPEALRGTPEARRGVLVKRAKPIQDRRIDLPIIGVKTIENAVAAGLAGIAVEAGGALAIDRGGLIKAADAAGLFLYGFTQSDL